MRLTLAVLALSIALVFVGRFTADYLAPPAPAMTPLVKAPLEPYKTRPAGVVR